MTAKAAFRNLFANLEAGTECLPRLDAYLYEPDIPGFTLEISPRKKRLPDGKFHPSTHPTWTEHQLQLWLTDPSKLRSEAFDATSTMATTVGEMIHAFLQHAMMEDGYLTAIEVPFSHDETRATGKADGLTHTGKLWELKSAHPGKVANIPDGPPDSPAILAYVKEKWPVYFAQAQEYLRMSGMEVEVFIMVSTSYPYQRREIHIYREDAFCDAVAAKYRRVIARVEEGREPVLCCPPRSKQAQDCMACWSVR